MGNVVRDKDSGKFGNKTGGQASHPVVERLDLTASKKDVAQNFTKKPLDQKSGNQRPSAQMSKPT